MQIRVGEVIPPPRAQPANIAACMVAEQSHRSVSLILTLLALVCLSTARARQSAAMSAEDRIRALEALVQQQVAAAQQAAAGAQQQQAQMQQLAQQLAQAQQAQAAAPPPQSNGTNPAAFVDTRVLGKPQTFSGDEAS